MPSQATLNALKRHAFRKGNKGGPGNPLAKQTNQLRAALVNAVTRADVDKIAKGLLRKAKKGDVAAARELFDRLFGKANQPISLTGSAAKAARSIAKAFDHARYAELFRASHGAGGANGRQAPAADRN